MKKFIVGVLLLLVGVFLIFNNLGLVDRTVYHWVISWQSLLIAIGFILLFDNRTSNKEGGAILMIIGLLFLLPRIFDIPSIRHFVLPAVIIGVGLVFLIKSTRKKDSSSICGNGIEDFGNEFREEFSKEWNENWQGSFSSERENRRPNAGDGDVGFVKRQYIFSGSKEKWSYDNVKRIEIESVFSGVEIDLSRIELSRGVNTVHVKVTTVFGGVTLYIPSEWNPTIQKTGVFGNFTDHRPSNMDANNEPPKVVLELEAVFGGGEIRYYE